MQEICTQEKYLEKDGEFEWLSLFLDQFISKNNHKSTKHIILYSDILLKKKPVPY